MRPSNDGVQFFGLAEDHWKSRYDNASAAARISGSTANVTVGMSTAANRAEGRAGSRRLERRVGLTGRAQRGVPIIATRSATAVPVSVIAAWGIMVQKS